MHSGATQSLDAARSCCAEPKVLGVRDMRTRLIPPTALTPANLRHIFCGNTGKYANVCMFNGACACADKALFLWGRDYAGMCAMRYVSLYCAAHSCELHISRCLMNTLDRPRVTSQGPEAGQKQEKNGPGRHFASSYSTRARDLAKNWTTLEVKLSM